MTLLLLYITLALGVSFLCSVAEAVLLSVTSAYSSLLEQSGKRSGSLLASLTRDVERPLAAILTLNTIAHTIGAAGAGAQATVVFGSAYLGLFSAILTLLILVLSEIIPKTLGAYYWRTLAPATAYSLHYLIKVLSPFIRLSELLTKLITRGERSGSGLNRQELAIAADISSAEGHLDENESEVVKNLLSLRHTTIREAMTPRTVLFTEDADSTIGEAFSRHNTMPFSRIPIYERESDNISGVVLLNDLLLAQARGETHHKVGQYKRELPALLDAMPLTQALEEFLRQKTHMILVVTEFGDIQGVITLEDVLETLLGREIVDESDKARDMQELARRHWQRQARRAQQQNGHIENASE
ncbi:hemolysin family protein [Gilvimarinus sp. SDUM040013]|uniref:Hemolysin family protein n=1 Tax=Gilvimarinus gilvus TaxID=3058038 RepID=A0ABU4RUQ3_9GAMM|nr:hemolysin family protein [Gilvimarinus sp. SDUM040013]MDO3388519.1 hemolysin family protein [Gilvimarinus sp. SDUM040013]MDX6848609.1 hemolysin family protein [Gilvimarinus sp. SDUM040013]